MSETLNPFRLQPSVEQILKENPQIESMLERLLDGEPHELLKAEQLNEYFMALVIQDSIIVEQFLQEQQFRSEKL